MNRNQSLIRLYLPALLLSLYTLSFWVLPQDWSEGVALDGSWEYALGKYRELGFSLGRDSWFTYGPIAHWFGPPMGAEQFQPLPYYILGLFVAGVLGISFSRILASQELPLPVRIISVLIFPFFFFGLSDSPELYLVLALFSLLVSSCLEKITGNGTLFSLVALSACGLLFKFSFGMLSLFILVVVLATQLPGKKISGKQFVLSLAGFAALLSALFAAITGSYGLFSYLALGLETSAKYSEIMIRTLPDSPTGYIIGLVYLAAGCVLVWQASKKAAGPWAVLCLVVSYLGALLLLYKHGFVRADFSHLKVFYSSVSSINCLLALVAFTGYGKKAAWEKTLLCCASLVLLVIYSVMLDAHQEETSPASLPGNWLACGKRLVSGVHGQNPAVFSAKKAVVKGSQPQLFSFLNAYSRSFRSKGRKPRITFYPWELMFFEAVEGFDLAPSPSLQLYASGPHTKVQRMEAEFLSSEHRPDVVVLGPGSIDDRSPVSELSDLLPPLYAHYRLAAVIEGYSVLEAREGGGAPEAAIRRADAPQGGAGEFLRVSFDQPGSVNKLAWKLATTLFKSPELYVVVTVTDDKNQKREYGWRGYLSQLQGGVYLSSLELPDFLGSTFKTSATMPQPLPQAGTSITGAVAELRRSGGFWNLPVIDPVVPLKVEFCSFR